MFNLTFQNLLTHVLETKREFGVRLSKKQERFPQMEDEDGI